jgi:quercetin dioxygenase-like cupin family protein
MKNFCRGWALWWCLLVCTPTLAGEGEFVTIEPQDVAWKDYPAIPGLKVAILQGNPSSSGLYIIRVKFSPGTMTRPHSHPDDRFVTVMQGTWYAGTGTVFDPENTQGLPAGSLMKHPAGAAHFDGAKDEEVIVQIMGIGPSKTVYANPEDDPAKK